MSNLSHQGTPSPDDASGSTSTADSENQRRPKKQKGISDYQARREANIAENKRLLAGLGLSEGGSSAILGKSATNVKRKKG